MSKCPKCDGTSGFTYHLTLNTNRAGSWGQDDDEEVDAERIYDPATVQCMDCGKRIKWNIAHGLESGLTPDQADTCPTCHGECHIPQTMFGQHICPDCNGTGKRR